MEDLKINKILHFYRETI